MPTADIPRRTAHTAPKHKEGKKRMYKTRGYPIDHELRRANRAQRNPHRFRTLHTLAARAKARIMQGARSLRPE